MTRRTPAVVALGTLTALTALFALSALSATAAASAPAGSVALYGAAGGDFQAVRGLTGMRPHKTTFFDINGDRSIATTVNPVGGKDGLMCDDQGRIFRVRHLRTTPALDGPPIDASSYTDEGEAGYGFYCGGVAVHGSFGLAMGNSQGALQLIRKKGEWKIDKRVQSPGLNEAGQPHRPGWIRFGDTSPPSTLFDNVAIAPEATPSGKYLAVAVDRSEGSIVVILGVGTAHPRVIGSLRNDEVLRNLEAPYGAGVLAWVPGSPDRAVIGTSTGFALLNMHQPAAPRLKNAITVGDGSLLPRSITVSHDRDHVAVAIGDRVYGYRNLTAVVKHRGQFQLQTSFTLHDSGVPAVSDVAYMPDDTLVVLHGDDADQQGWSLTLVRKVPMGRHAIGGSVSASHPYSEGSLSVWPVP